MLASGSPPAAREGRRRGGVKAPDSFLLPTLDSELSTLDVKGVRR
jgi:hypothetical protein